MTMTVERTKAPKPLRAANWKRKPVIAPRRSRQSGSSGPRPAWSAKASPLLRATGLTKVGPGGGTAGENITVHRVALDGLEEFLATRRAMGNAIDVRLLTLLGPKILEGC